MRRRVKAVLLVFVCLGNLSAAVPPSGKEAHHSRYYAYFYADGSNRQNHKHFAVVTEVFAYCTPTHNISRIADEEREGFKAEVKETVGADGWAYFYWNCC